MNKYKIGKYIVKADSIHDAVSIVRQIKDTSDDFDKDYARESQAVEKDVKKANEDYNRLGNKSASELFEMMGYKRDGHKYYKSNGSYTRVIVFNDFDDIKYYVLKDGAIPNGWTLTKTKWYDSVKDSVTVRDIIQSLVDEETSAISSYNVALETLKDHIPPEAYEAIKAIRDDEQSHIENLYAVLNGNITPKNLEN